MYRIRFIDPATNTVISDAVPKSLNVSWKLNQTSDWSASFPKNLTALQNVTKGSLIQVFNGTSLMLDGILQSVGEKWSGDSLDVNLTGRGIVDRLFDARSYSYGYYENQPRLLILALLLDRAGWRLGDISTWVSPTSVYTVDLRSDKRLLAQITTLMTGFPGIFFRYGGARAGAFTVDVGAFNDQSDLVLYRPSELHYIPDLGKNVGIIQDFTLSQGLTTIVNSVEVRGGAVKDNLGVSRTIFLKDALAGNPALATDPNFPIITDLANYIYSIRNNAIPLTQGAQSTERYSQYSPESTGANATVTAITTAGMALYERGVAFLLDHQSNPQNISIKATGDNLYMNVGDSAYISNTFRQAIIDPFTDEIVDTVESSVQDYYRVTGITLNVQSDTYDWSFELTNGTAIAQEDLFVSVFDQSKISNQVQGTSAIVGLNFPQLSTYTLNVPIGNFPDTTLSDGTPAYTVTIPQPITSLPVWTPTRMFSAGLPVISATDQPVLIELVQDFVYGTKPLIVKLGVKNSGWSAAISLTLTYYVVWSQ